MPSTSLKVDNDPLSQTNFKILLHKLLWQHRELVLNVDTIILRLEKYLERSNEVWRDRVRRHHERHVSDGQSNPTDSDTLHDNFPENEILRDQARYLSLLKTEWMNLRLFQTAFWKELTGGKRMDSEETIESSISSSQDTEITNCQQHTNGKEASGVIDSQQQLEEEEEVNDLRRIPEPKFPASHYLTSMNRTTENLGRQQAHPLIYSEFRLPVYNLHKLVSEFRVKVMSLYRFHNLSSGKKSHLMSCSCLRYLAMAQRIVANPDSEFKLLMSLEYKPEDVQSKQYSASNRKQTKQRRKDHRVDIDLVQDEILFLKYKEGNKRKIDLIYQGMTESNSHKCVTTSADELLSAARLNPFHYHTPQVVMEFLSGLTPEVAEELVYKGVHLVVRECNTLGVDKLANQSQNQNETIAGEENNDQHVSSNSGDDDDEEEYEEVDEEEQQRALQVILSQQQLPKVYSQHISVDSLYPNVVNIDITAMVCLTADMTHGYSTPNQISPSHHYHSLHSLIVPSLMQFLKGKEWICTKQARDDFMKILHTVAGEDEIERANRLFNEQITQIVDNDPSERILSMKKLKDSQKNVFGTGDKLKAITLTSNQSIVHRLLKQEGGISAYVFNNHSVRLGLRTDYYRNLLLKQQQEGQQQQNGNETQSAAV